MFFPNDSRFAKCTPAALVASPLHQATALAINAALNGGPNLCALFGYALRKSLCAPSESTLGTVSTNVSVGLCGAAILALVFVGSVRFVYSGAKRSNSVFFRVLACSISVPGHLRHKSCDKKRF